MSSELQQLRDAARQVVDGLGLAADAQATWDLITELGWLMVAVPEDQGGLGMGPAAACALHGELGRGLARVPFLPQMLAIDALVRSAVPAQEHWLEGLMSGAQRATAALGECAVVAREADEGELQLDGCAAAVPSADDASHLLVLTEDGMRVALVSLVAPGVTLTARPTWDTTRRLYDVQLTAVPLDATGLLASGAEALAVGQALAIQRDLALAASAVAGAAALLEMTVEYLQTRRQFGRPLALFQALKHRCAELKAMTEGASALLDNALAAAEAAAGVLRVSRAVEQEACAAKQLACAAFAAVAEESLQLHGGIGMTEEHPCHLYLKRALLDEHLGGDPARYDIELARDYLQSRKPLQTSDKE